MLSTISVPSLPSRVTLELTNRCNRACEGCPRHSMIYPIGDMSITLLTSITDQLTRNVCIVPFYRGEATLNPQFPEAMQILRRFREVQFATNADFLTRSNKKAILGACSFVSVSLHDYLLPHQTRLPAFFYEALDAGVETQLSILDPLVKDKTGFTEAWLRHVDRVRIYKTHSADGFGSMKGEEVPTGACSKPFEEMVVYWDGKAGLCNHDWNNGLNLGDLSTQSIKEVWQGKAYQKVRLEHQEGRRRMVAACRSCCFAPDQVYGELITNG